MQEFFAPANIALVKYWGKRDLPLNLPMNGSLSIGLGSLGTFTALEEAPADQVIFNGAELSAEGDFARKIFKFIDLFAAERPRLRVISRNNIPTAAGLASSASGFAALVRALNHFFAWSVDEIELSRRARRGSGSACRSLWPGFVRWNRGERADGSDSHGEPLPYRWPELRLAILPVDFKEKKMGSAPAMNHTVATSPLYQVWPASAEADLKTMERALADRDLAQLGALAEANALAMHATMLAARPSLCYLQPQSWAYLEQVQRLRSQGLPVYCTIDAGPNIKLLFEASNETMLGEHFPTAQFINPWC